MDKWGKKGKIPFFLNFFLHFPTPGGIVLRHENCGECFPAGFDGGNPQQREGRKVKPDSPLPAPGALVRMPGYFKEEFYGRFETDF